MRFLLSSYHEEDVSAFLERIDAINVSRIKKGLEHAKQLLEQAHEAQRGIKALDGTGLYSIFESLNCEAVFANENIVRDCFLRPFSLVQTNRTLKMSNFTPAMTQFLFGRDEDCTWWAQRSWARFRRNITATEFEWSVQGSLTKAMTRVNVSALEMDFQPQFWAGAKAIVEKLDKKLITHSLRALDVDICKLALDHLQLQSDGFQNVMATVAHLLKTSPTDFWEAMGAISPSTWIEQFFSSPSLNLLLVSARPSDMPMLEDTFHWLTPFLASIKPVHQVSACRALAKQLVVNLQQAKYPEVVHNYSLNLAYRLLASMCSSLYEDTSALISRAATSEALDIVVQYVVETDGHTGAASSSLSEASEVLSQAIILDVKSLLKDRELIIQDRPLQIECCTAKMDLWKYAARNSNLHDGLLAKKFLKAINGTIGLEPFTALNPKSLSKERLRFNSTFTGIHTVIRDALDLVNELGPTVIRTLFGDIDSTTSLIMLAFSSDADVRSATLDVTKTLTSRTARKDAMTVLLSTHWENTLYALSASFERLSISKAFSPTSAMLRLSEDILDALCNPQEGLLRSKTLSPSDGQALERFWGVIWQELNTIFTTTEKWSNMGFEKSTMEDFCRDTMEFADNVFEQFGVFAGALDTLAGASYGSAQVAGTTLIAQPKLAMTAIVRWLKLRGDVLVSRSNALVCKLLARFKQFHAQVEESSLDYIEDVITNRTRTTLTTQQKAELHRALEEHVGHSVAMEESVPASATSKDSIKSRKDHVIDLDTWQAKARSDTSGNDSADSDTLQSVIAASSSASDRFRAKQLAKLASQKPQANIISKLAAQKPIDAAEFRKKRELEQQEKKRRDALAVAAARKRATGHSEEGSGLASLGVIGKDHSAPKGEGMMVSSEDESDSEEDDMDRELFGVKKHVEKSDAVRAYEAEKMKALRRQKAQGPVKKQRLVRSTRDMRARLAPDLAPLHKALLGWEYFHDGAYPPNSSARDYSAVLSTFRDAHDYQRTFQPLLLLEAWNGFLKAKEENTARTFEITIANRSSVDAFTEISTTMTHSEAKEISEGDIILLSKCKTPAATADEPHCLSRVFRMGRKKAHVEVTYRVVPSPVIQTLSPSSVIFGLKITSIVPLEREYGALLGLQYFDLCDEISKAKPSPLLKYTPERLQPLVVNYSVNMAQAKAIKSAIDNDAFTLVQGPPGSGKTKTIVAIVGAILTESLNNKAHTISQPRSHPSVAKTTTPPVKKLLVCAPSNAAVDELVMRFKAGVRTTTGAQHELNIVRLGRSDAINANVQDVTLDELINRKLNVTPAGDSGREETRKVMDEHKLVSEQLRVAREKLDEAERKVLANCKELKEEMDTLRQRKAQLSRQVDAAKDNEGAQSRQAELSRRRAQQEIIDGAHVICATLSGSGHEMFQNLNVEFETVIIDEAAQCVELSALIPLKYGCAKCVLVGDPQQLPPTVFSREAARFKYEQSLFVRMQANHPNDVHLLDTQYRMHPDISVFPSQTFYNNRLLDGVNMATLRSRPWHASELLRPFQFFDIEGQHQSAPKGHSLVNYAEIRIAEQLFNRLLTDFQDYSFKGKVGIITPYKSQLRELKDHFRRKFPQDIVDGIEFNTTDAFQGRESDIIIFSCVRASPAGGIGFLQDIRRMNVGLTRAMSSLWVLGNANSLSKGEYWAKLVESAKARGRYTRGNIEAMLGKKSVLVRKVTDGSTKEVLHISSGQTATPVIGRRLSDMDRTVTKIEHVARKQAVTKEAPAGTGLIRPQQDHMPANVLSGEGTLKHASNGKTNGVKAINGFSPSAPVGAPVDSTAGPATAATTAAAVKRKRFEEMRESASDSSSSEDSDTVMEDAPVAPTGPRAAPITKPEPPAKTAAAAQKPARAPPPALLRKKNVDVFIRPQTKKPRP